MHNTIAAQIDQLTSTFKLGIRHLQYTVVVIGICSSITIVAILAVFNSVILPNLIPLPTNYEINKINKAISNLEKTQDLLDKNE